jgi:hypothetical protein
MHWDEIPLSSKTLWIFPEVLRSISDTSAHQQAPPFSEGLFPVGSLAVSEDIQKSFSRRE